MFKDGPSWAVELPAFGFSPLTVHGGFESREDAASWLTERKNGGSGPSLVQFARTPEGRDHRWGPHWQPVYR